MNTRNALTVVAIMLNSLNIPWRLFASGALMVWGVDIVPQDLDVFVSAEDVIKLERLFSKDIINPLHKFNDNGSDYLEFQMKIDGVVIEICELNDLGNIVLVDYNGEKIPLTPLKEIRDEYIALSGFQDRLPLIQKSLD